MGWETFGEFEASYRKRHRARATQALHAVGDLLYVGGPLLGVVRGSPRVVMLGLLGGATVTSVGHLFGGGSLPEELQATFGHPLWAAVAEVRRLLGRATASDVG